MHPTNLKIGKTIKHLRKQKNLSQEALATGSTLGIICSVKTLRRIESGEAAIKPYVLTQLLLVLGTKPEEFYAMLYGSDLRAFESDIELIWELGFAEDFDSFRDKFEELKTKEYCNTEIPVIFQSLLLCESVLLSNVDNDYTASLDKLYQAVSLTSPMLLTNIGEIDFDNASKVAISFAEYRVLRQIANTKAKSGDILGSVNANKAILTLLESVEPDIRIKKKLLPATYFNLSTIMLDENIEGAHEIIERGLKFCTKHKELKLHWHLWWNKGRVHHQTGDTIQAERCFRQSITLLAAQDDTATIAQLVDAAKTKCGLDLG